MPTKPTRLARQSRSLTRVANAVKQGSAFFQWYAQNPDDLDNQIDMSLTPGFRAEDATNTAITVSQETVNLPRVNAAGRTPYTAGAELPFIYRPSPVLRFTSTAINGTSVFNLVPTDYSKSNFLYIVYRRTGTALTAGNLRLVLRSTVGNEVVLTSQKSATAGTWVYEIFDFQSNGKTGVAFTGTPNFAVKMATDVVLPTSGTTIEISKIYTAQNQDVFPPFINSEDLGSKCLEALTAELNISTFDLTCALDLKDKVSTGYNPVWSFELKEDSLLLRAAAFGTTPLSLEVQTIQKQLEYTITSNVVTLGSQVGVGKPFVDIKKVSIPSADVSALSSSLVSASSDLDNDEYYLDPTAGTLTFRSGLYPNGTKVLVTVGTVTKIDSIRVKNNDMGTIGRLVLSLEENGQTEVFNYVAKLMPESINLPNDNSVTRTYTLSVLDVDGVKELNGIY